MLQPPVTISFQQQLLELPLEQLIALKESPRGKNWEGACAIEARLLTTLEAALATANTAAPGVPAGARNV